MVISSSWRHEDRVFVEAGNHTPGGDMTQDWAPPGQVMPAAFFGHGNPMNALEVNRYTAAWRAFGLSVPRPRAILVISAHWYINATAVTAMPRPRTIHDFFGFPKALFDVQYPAPGLPELADEVSDVVHPTWVVVLQRILSQRLGQQAWGSADTKGGHLDCRRTDIEADDDVSSPGPHITATGWRRLVGGRRQRDRCRCRALAPGRSGPPGRLGVGHHPSPLAG